MDQKRLFGLAVDWIELKKPSFGADYDVIDVFECESGYHIEVSLFDRGKYYCVGLDMPREFVTSSVRDERIGGLGI